MMPNNQRLAILLGGCILFVCLLIGRTFYLQVYKHDFFVNKSRNQLLRYETLYPNRGMIFDRHRRPLALTQKRYSAYAVPKAIDDKANFASVLSQHIGVPKQRILRRLKTHQSFVWIRRKLTPETYEKLKTLDIEGLLFIPEKKRVYPHGSLAADVLGFVGIDNQGLGGLEYAHDQKLKGSAGRMVIEGDPIGRRLATGQKHLIPPYDGGHLITTLDERIQFMAEEALAKGVKRYSAASGQVVVMNPKTGDILAMADYPAFDPNGWWDSKAEYRKNSCVTDVYEPGSVFKVITLAAVLNEGLKQPHSVMIVPERLRVLNRTIKEAHDREDGETDRRTVSEILEKSLNVGTTLMAQELGQERFYTYMRDFGFGRSTGVRLPGESYGLLRPTSAWSGVDIAMHSFGQGLAVTPLQLATAISAVANDGVLVKPRILTYITYEKDRKVKGNPIRSGGRIISEKAAKQVQEMMVKTVEQGTGVIAKIPGYRIAGKTGTAQKPRQDGLGYEKGKYVASFLGFFPADDPEILILAIVDSPKKKIWGSTVAGPIFKDIAIGVIDYLNILPGHLTGKTVALDRNR